MAAGYGEQYRNSAWVPVRVTIRNQENSVVSGTVEIPDHADGGSWASPGYYTLYQMPVLLPPEATKQVTLYLPGQDLRDYVDVRFRAGGKVLASGYDSPGTVGDQTITLGALADDAGLTSWLRQIEPQGTSADVIRLAPSTIDPVAGALGTFDAIVLTNVDTSRLDRNQLAALEGYVQAGGSLILVGGPNWQETLRPLPSSLVPGQLAGTRTVPDLSGLAELGRASPPGGATVVSLLRRPRGSVLAGEAGIPLVVRDTMGRGRIMYLAFDPAVDTIARWRGAANLLTELVNQATPQVASRVSPGGWRPRFFGARVSPSIMLQELARVPTATLYSLMLLVLLTVLSILLVGPINFLLLHRLGKRELAWVTVPSLALLCLGSTLALADRFKSNVVLLNTLGMVELDGAGDVHPATFYVGLFSSVRGDYHLVWNGQALPQGVPQYSFDQMSSAQSVPLGLRLQEGGHTAVDFASMPMWSTRSVALQTTVSIPGTVRATLHLAPDGSIVGVIRNATNLTLLHPVVIAGNAVLRLSDLAPGVRRMVHVQPSADSNQTNDSLLWDRVYGSSATSDEFSSWDGDPWEEPSAGSENSLIDRLRNVAERLPEARDVTALGEVLFAAWSENPLGTFRVDGAAPQRRDLTLIVTPLSIRFPTGSFRLRTGTLGAYLIEARPQQPTNPCCGAPFGAQGIDLGPGGSATFQFDIPNARRTHFSRLTLSANAMGDDGIARGQVYDWHAGRWLPIELQASGTPLRRPGRFISPDGALLVRVRATSHSGDILINDPHQDLQLSGWSTAR